MTDNKLPNEDDISKALHYLATTDKDYAQSVAHVKGMEYQIKTIKAVVVLESEGPVAERQAKSESSVMFTDFTKEYEAAVYDRELVSARRKRAELTIGVWQSLVKASKQGNIT